LLARWLEDAELFVCTDAAGRPYAELPRKPDLVIGDFDSLGAAAREEGLRFEHVPDQDSSDAEKALRYLPAAGCQEAALLGATGRRLDHTLYNVLLLGRFARTLRLCLVDDETLSVALHPAESYRWALPADTLFSLLPLGAPAAGVTLGGAKYTIENATIGIAGPSALSNRVAAPPLKLRFDSGLLLLCVPAASDRGARRSEA